MRKFEWPKDGKDRYGSPNPEYDPAACGLEVVVALEEADMSYEFNMFRCWRDIETGRYYCASDSGCSCPSPFEDYHSLADFTEVGDESDLRASIEDWNNRFSTPAVPAVEVESALREFRASTKKVTDEA